MTTKAERPGVDRLLAATVRPCELRPDQGGLLINTLGKAECEMVAALIIRWHHVNGHTEWQPVSRRDLGNLLKLDELAASWVRNPFWHPDPHDFERRGFIVGWSEPSDKGTLTDKFFAGVSKRSIGSSCPRCFPGRPGFEIIDHDGVVGFQACSGCARKEV